VCAVIRRLRVERSDLEASLEDADRDARAGHKARKEVTQYISTDNHQNTSYTDSLRGDSACFCGTRPLHHGCLLSVSDASLCVVYVLCG
jgi:hypothetical protein